MAAKVPVTCVWKMFLVFGYDFWNAYVQMMSDLLFMKLFIDFNYIWWKIQKFRLFRVFHTPPTEFWSVFGKFKVHICWQSSLKHDFSLKITIIIIKKVLRSVCHLWDLYITLVSTVTVQYLVCTLFSVRKLWSSLVFLK